MKPNKELFKIANNTVSFIAENFLGFKADDGQIFDKIALLLIKRDNANRAIQTLRYYLDIPACKVLCHDLWTGALHQEYSEFKKRGNTQRALNIDPLDESGAYRIGIMNQTSQDAEQERLFFDLNRFNSRAFARTVLDFLNYEQMARQLAAAKEGGNNVEF